MNRRYRFIRKVLVPFICAIVLTGCRSKIVHEDAVVTDTTSHIIEWKSYLFGSVASSSIEAVHVFDETNVWAFGQIEVLDSIGRNSEGINLPYNALHWNGITWDSLRLSTHLGISHELNLFPLSVVAFKENDIWITSGRSLHHFDGKTIVQSLWIYKPTSETGVLDEGQDISQLWGKTDEYIFGVGKKGAIIFFDGTQVIKVPCSTTLDFYDIFGALNTITGRYDILAIAGDYLSPSTPSELYSVTSYGSTKIASIPSKISTLWFGPNLLYYLAGSTIYQAAAAEGTYQPISNISGHSYIKIRGEKTNDIFVIGSSDEMMHFNGAEWFHYETNLFPPTTLFTDISIAGPLVVCGGYSGDKGVVIIGKRKYVTPQ